MKTVLITGALGYIARSLYKRFSRDNYEVIGIDNNFIPDKVARLREMGVRYYNKDLFNIKDLLGEADIVIHTAGITAVPTVKSQCTPQGDAEITRVGVDGTREIIKHSKDEARIIFLSTHVIYESFTEQVFDIDEDCPPCPSLAYASGKWQSEQDLRASGKNFITLRLSSVYGYNPCVRWKILPNLFSKMASQNEKIKVFGSGLNIKPLVGIQDVGRCIKFMAESNFNRETFNVVNEHRTVKEVAEICKSYNNLLDIDFTVDEIPNLGYTVTNKKLLSTGFKLTQNVEDEIGNMIDIWS